MNNKNLEIRLRGTNESIEWEVIQLHGQGHCSNTTDAWNDAEKFIMEKLKTMAPPVPGTMAPNPNPEMVPTPLTKEQRQQLYDIVYGAMDIEHHGPEGLDRLQDKGITTPIYHKMLALLSE